MFGGIDKSKGFLFCTYDLAGTLSNATAEMQREIDSINADRLLNTAPYDLAKYFSDKFQMEPLKIKREDWYAEDKEVKVDVRYDQMRWIEDTSRPCLVPGIRIEVRVPFEGNSELLYSSPNTMTSNPPRAVVQDNEIVLRYESPIDAPRDVRPLIDSELPSI